MTVKKLVTPDNLNKEHFKLNHETKTIDVIFPKNQSAEATVEVQDAFGEPIGKIVAIPIMDSDSPSS